MAADSDRSQVYAAELAAFDGTDLETVVGFGEVRRAIVAVTSGEWWPPGCVEVRASRGDALSSVTQCGVSDGSIPQIRIAEPQATIATGAHELAHALARVSAGHGARFRRAHLDVVLAITNVSRIDGRGWIHVDQLADAYRSAGLAIGARDWLEPPEPGGAIAL